MKPAVTHIGNWQVDGPACRIVHGENVVGLEPKVMDLLLFLADQPNEVVSRDALLAELWPGVVVGEDTLARTVSKLRQALADDVKQPEYIETIPKRGYRLIAEVRSKDDSQGSAPKLQLQRVVLVVAALVILASIFLALFVTRDNPQADSEIVLLGCLA